MSIGQNQVIGSQGWEKFLLCYFDPHTYVTSDIYIVSMDEWDIRGGAAQWTGMNLLPSRWWSGLGEIVSILSL